MSRVSVVGRLRPRCAAYAVAIAAVICLLPASSVAAGPLALATVGTGVPGDAPVTSPWTQVNDFN